MATIKEIAKIANCSIGTVSRVLNFDKSLRVSDDKRKLILEVAENLQYKTVRQRTNKVKYKIGIVSMYNSHEELDDPFYMSIRLGIEQAIDKYDCDFIVLYDSDGYDYGQINGVDGIIAIGHFLKKEIKELNKITSNIVFVNSSPDANKYDSILFDGKNAVRQVVNYLVSLGHEKIGYIGVRGVRESKKLDLDEYRYELVKNYFEENGIYDGSLIYYGGSKAIDGYEIMKKIIDEDNLPTAFFVGNDSMCIGVLKALYEAGIKVPEQISLIGYNDITNAEFTIPPLSTIRVYTELMGSKALDMLIERTKGRVIPLKVVTPTKLVIRKSAAKHIK